MTEACVYAFAKHAGRRERKAQGRNRIMFGVDVTREKLSSSFSLELRRLESTPTATTDGNERDSDC